MLAELEMELNYLVVKYNSKLQKIMNKTPNELNMTLPVMTRVYNENAAKAQVLFSIFEKLYDKPEIPDFGITYISKEEKQKVLDSIIEDIQNEKKGLVENYFIEPTEVEMVNDPYYFTGLRLEKVDELKLEEALEYFKKLDDQDFL